ncbi:MAG: PAAR domain-containing protein [Acetobacter aceti]|uniref:PAAR domain-containing protein n=1 Tax=Acetobacter aceti TaxID=435 RepID=UPI00098AB7D2|nr:PAAR domain-containing protein [Acetobacter aceti]
MSGKPAARLTDMHTCPKTTAQMPHVGGPVVTGSPNVFINGRPAARVGDRATCQGPPDKISEGSATVFINGKPASRMGDRTEHGGVIIGGSGNVFIGDTGGGDPCPRQASSLDTPFYDLS